MKRSALYLWSACEIILYLCQRSVFADIQTREEDPVGIVTPPAVHTAIVDFGHVIADSSDIFIYTGIPEHTLIVLLQPVSVGLYTHSRKQYSRIDTYDFLQNSAIGFPRTCPGENSPDIKIGVKVPEPAINLFDYSISDYSVKPSGRGKSINETLANIRTNALENHVSLTIPEVDIQHYYYDTLAARYRINLMTIPVSMAGLSTLDGAAQELDVQIRSQLECRGSFSWKDIHWGRVVASGLSAGFTNSYYMAAIGNGSRAGANTLDGLLIRSAVAGGIDIGVQSLGMRFDSRKHGYDFQQAQRSMMINRVFNAGLAGIRGVVNRYILRNTWDPWFDDFSKKVTGYNPQDQAMGQFQKNVMSKSTYFYDESGNTSRSTDDTIAVAPVIDFGWPIINTEEKQDETISIPIRREIPGNLE